MNNPASKPLTSSSTAFTIHFSRIVVQLSLDRDDMIKEETIDLLNELIHVCKDGEHGYRTAAEDVRNSQLQSVFTEYAKQRGSAGRQLQAEVERLGGAATDSGTLTAAVHRGWIDLKAALSGGDGGAIVAACETGEDHTLAAFERVVNAGITGESLSIVEKQYGKIKEAHTRLVRLKEEMSRGAEFQQNE
jgi:uncharacterized protein (TIGR02284 family)